MTGPLVLVVEDEQSMRRFLRAALESHDYRVTEATTCEEALRAATSHNPELVLLDLGLPDGDGLSLLERLREWSRVPIVVLSARGREQDKVAALDTGADDYLTKPFGTGELLARLRVAIRHAAASGPTGEVVATVGPISIDHGKREVRVRGELVHLTPIEFRLLSVLARHADRVLTHRQILKEVWGPNAQTQTHYLRVYMAQLRRKVERDPARPRWLVTEPDVGYRLRDGDKLEPP